MPHKFVLASRNAHKVEELDRILKLAGVDAELLTVADFPDAPEVPETESTFEGNALLKARALSLHSGLTAIADDSGLCVNALNGMPGVLSARWSGSDVNPDLANMELVLRQMSDVPDIRRGAQFVCAAAVVHANGEEFTVRGTVDGMLVRTPRGSNGFGYDPIFIPQGFDITTAEMTPEQKDAISHRGQALRQLATLI